MWRNWVYSFHAPFFILFLVFLSPLNPLFSRVIELERGIERGFVLPKNLEKLGKPLNYQEFSHAMGLVFQNLPLKVGRELFYEVRSGKGPLTVFFKWGIFPNNSGARSLVTVKDFIETLFLITRKVQKEEGILFPGFRNSPFSNPGIREMFRAVGVFEEALMGHLSDPISIGEGQSYLIRWMEQVIILVEPKGLPPLSFGDLPPGHHLYPVIKNLRKYELLKKIPKGFLFQENLEAPQIEFFHILADIHRQFTLKSTPEKKRIFRKISPEHFAYENLNYLMTESFLTPVNLGDGDILDYGTALHFSLWIFLDILKFKGERVKGLSLNQVWELSDYSKALDYLNLTIPFPATFLTADSPLTRGEMYHFIQWVLGGIERFYKQEGPKDILNSHALEELKKLIEWKEADTLSTVDPAVRSEKIGKLLRDLKGEMLSYRKNSLEEISQADITWQLKDFKSGHSPETFFLTEEEIRRYTTPSPVRKRGEVSSKPQEKKPQADQKPADRLFLEDPNTTIENGEDPGIVRQESKKGPLKTDPNKIGPTLREAPDPWLTYLESLDKKVSRMRKLDDIAPGNRLEKVFSEDKKRYQGEKNLINRFQTGGLKESKPKEASYRPRGRFLRGSLFGPTGLSLTPTNRTLQPGRIRLSAAAYEPEPLGRPRFQILEAGLTFAGKNVEAGLTQRSSNLVDLNLPHYFGHLKIALSPRLSLGGIFDASVRKEATQFKETIYGVYAIGNYFTLGIGSNIGEKNEQSLFGEKQPFFRANTSNYYTFAGLRFPLAGERGQLAFDSDFQMWGANLSFYLLENRVVADADFRYGPQYPDYRGHEGRTVGRINFLFY